MTSGLRFTGVIEYYHLQTKEQYIYIIAGDINFMDEDNALSK